jgi:hypothetical protein
MKIALDVDGVLADIIFAWLEEYNKTHEKIMRKEDIAQWDFWKRLGFDKYMFFAELSRCWSKWTEVPPMEEDIAKAVEKLHSLGTVDIVTARDADSTKYVKQWLEHNRIKYDEYVAVMTGREKADLEYDIFIDDSPHNVVRIASKGKNAIVYDQPWNRNVNGEKIVRIKRLEEAAQVISDLPKKFGDQYTMQSFLDK